MTKRTCPVCGATNYSADTIMAAWKCGACGGDIPRECLESLERHDNRKEAKTMSYEDLMEHEHHELTVLRDTDLKVKIYCIDCSQVIVERINPKHCEDVGRRMG